jgi:pyruvate dehydrogenase (quinone)/pyruvate oxidase
VIAYVGDGGFAMLMAEFLTAARGGVPIKMAIDNDNPGQIRWEQMVFGPLGRGAEAGFPQGGLDPAPAVSGLSGGSD